MDGANERRGALLAASAWALVLGAVTIAAWHRGWSALIAPIPGAPGISYLSGITFLLTGVSTLFFALRQYAAAIAGSVLVLAIAAIQILDILSGDLVGLEAWIYAAALRIDVPDSVPMAFESALAQGALSLGLIGGSWRRRTHPSDTNWLAVFGTAAFAATLVPLFDYVAGWYPGLATRHLTHVSVPALTGFLVLSAGFLFHSRSGETGRSGLSRMPLMATLAGVIISLSLWNMTEQQQTRRLADLSRVESENLVRQLVAHLESQMKNLERMAARWQNDSPPYDDADARDAWLYVRQNPEAVAIGWIDDQTRLRDYVADNIDRRHISQITLPDDVAGVFESAVDSGGAQIASHIHGPDGRRYFLAIVPVPNREPNQFLAALYGVKETVERASSTLLRNRYAVTVLENGVPVYGAAPVNDKHGAALQARSSVSYPGLPWTVYLRPNAAYARSMQTALPQIVLGAGLIMSMLLGWAFAQRNWARMQSHALTRVNARLEEEIHERIAVEKALRANEEEYRFLADAIPQMVWTTNDQGDVQYCNRLWIEYTGIRDFQHARGMEAIHPEDLAYTEQAWAHALETGSPFEIRVRMKRAADGAYRWHLVRAMPMRNENGAVTKWFGTNTDIHDHAQTELALRESEERFRRTVAGSYDGLWEWDMETGDTWYTPRFGELLGFSVAELADKTLPDFVHPEERGRFRRTLQKSIDAGTQLDIECRLLTKDGLFKWFHVRAAATHSPDAISTRMSGSIQDVDSRKQAEQALRRTNTTLRQHSLALNQKNQEVEAFVYIVSHDLRAPLVNLQGFSQELAMSCDELRNVLANCELPESTAATIKRITEDDMGSAMRFISASMQKFERLISALLVLSRSGRQEYRFQELDMQQLAQSCVDSLRQLINDRKANVKIRRLPNAWGDATAVDQLLSNLVANALNYLDPKRPGQVEIGGEAQGAEAVFWVRDNGVGIPAAAQGRLFQVFQRFHPEIADGEGMGLAIVKRIAERHGGRVWVDSRENAGTTFYFSLMAVPAMRLKLQGSREGVGAGDS